MTTALYEQSYKQAKIWNKSDAWARGFAYATDIGLYYSFAREHADKYEKKEAKK